MTETTKQKNAINASIDLFQRRYVLRIIWELREQSLTFRLLQEACNDISPSTLNLRLNDLRGANLVTHATGEGYALSDLGQQLLQTAGPLMNWVVNWHSASGKSRKTAAKPKAAVRGARTAPAKKKPLRRRAV